MGLFVFGIVMAVVLVIVLAIIGNNDCEWYNYFAIVVSVILGLVTAIGLCLLIVFAVDWKSAEYKAKVINREYDTSYTREEVFYASDVIDTIRELDRKRVEINGDILKK